MLIAFACFSPYPVARVAAVGSPDPVEALEPDRKDWTYAWARTEARSEWGSMPSAVMPRAAGALQADRH